jgi:hypothetical protein
MIITIIPILFWLHLAGQSVDPRLTWPVYALWLALAGWVAIRCPRWLLFLAMLAVAALAVGVMAPWGLRRLATIAGYAATYQALKIHRLNLNPALAVSAIIMSIFVIVGIYLGNQNVVAGFIYLAAPAALDAFTDWRRWATLAITALALALTGSRGAWLAAAVAGIVYARRWLALGAVPIVATAMIWLRPLTIADRWQVWTAAVSDLSLWGRGFGAAIYPSLGGGLFYHAHCLPLTVAVETGISGLAALAWGLWRLVPRLAHGWQGATLAGLLAWSFLDEVIWFWGAGMFAVYLLAEVMREVT